MQTILQAAMRPLFLVVLLVAVATGLTVTWWLLPLGVAVYVLAVALAARDPQLARDAQRATRPRLDSPKLRGLLDEINGYRSDIYAAVERSDMPLQRLLSGIAEQADVLVEQAQQLAVKGEIIERYLKTVNRSGLDDQISRVEVQLPRTTDQYTQRQLQETRNALVERRTNAEALQTYGERIEAQLRNIGANLSNVLAETVRLQTADAVSVDSTGNQVAEHLRDLNSDMDAFQRTLDTALASSGAAG